MEGPFRGEKNIAGLAHNREVAGITDTALGTFLLPPGVYGYRIKFTGGVDGDVIKVVEDATPVDKVDIDTITTGAVTTIKTKTAHNLQTSNPVHLRGMTEGDISIAGQHAVTVTGIDTFTIPVDTSLAVGDYSGGIAIDLTQANTWLKTPATVDPDVDLQYRKLTQRAITNNDGFSEAQMFDAVSEGVRRIDCLAAQTGTYGAELETF